MQPSNILFLKIYIYFNFSVLLAVVMHCEDVPQSILMKPAQNEGCITTTVQEKKNIYMYTHTYTQLLGSVTVS